MLARATILSIALYFALSVAAPVERMEKHIRPVDSIHHDRVDSVKPFVDTQPAPYGREDREEDAVRNRNDHTKRDGRPIFADNAAEPKHHRRPHLESEESVRRRPADEKTEARDRQRQIVSRSERPQFRDDDDDKIIRPDAHRKGEYKSEHHRVQGDDERNVKRSIDSAEEPHQHKELRPEGEFRAAPQSFESQSQENFPVKKGEFRDKKEERKHDDKVDRQSHTKRQHDDKVGARRRPMQDKSDFKTAQPLREHKGELRGEEDERRKLHGDHTKRQLKDQARPLEHAKDFATARPMEQLPTHKSQKPSQFKENFQGKKPEFKSDDQEEDRTERLSRLD